MLDPQQDRRQLFDALRPPDGYILDQAIATTFSLNLLTLLTVPLAYTFAGSHTDESNALPDPIILLHGLRENIEKFSIFCQAGQMVVPKANQRLFTYLEDIVFEVETPRPGGIFHPKVWLLRYLPEPSNEDESLIKYRFLCVTRNLTFDQSWDTMLVLDGHVTPNRKLAYSINHPLGDFIASLPEMAVRGVTNTAKQSVQLLSDEVRRVSFELPWSGIQHEYIPLGLKRSSFSFPDYRKLLVVSPFTSDSFLENLQSRPSNIQLISRWETLTTLSHATISSLGTIHYLDPYADPDEDLDEQLGQAEDDQEILEESINEEFQPPTTGLHAKLFIGEYGRSDVDLYTGSANATKAAFTNNVEFLVKLTGRRAQFGIQKLLTEDKQNDKEIRLIDLLQLYDNHRPAETDPLEEELEKVIHKYRRHLIGLPLKAIVSNKKKSSAPQEATFDITLENTEPAKTNKVILDQNEKIKISCWPITLHSEDAITIQPTDAAFGIFKTLSYAALTTFFAFEIEATLQKKRHAQKFVLNIPLVNAPTDRKSQVLRFLLDNRSKVLNYLLFLLSENDYSYASVESALLIHEQVRHENNPIFNQIDLFESMVRTLHRNPNKLDLIFNLVTDLEKANNLALLPEQFFDIWEPIWEARQMLRQEGNQA